MQTARFFDDVYRPQRLRGARPRTLDEYRSICRSFDRWQIAARGFASIEHIDADLFARYLADVFDQASPGTSNKHRAHLASLFRFAVKRGRLSEFPDVEPARVDRPLADSWDIANEFSAIIRAAGRVPGRFRNGVERSTFWLGLLLTLYDTGLRIRSAMSLDVSNVDLAAGLVRVEAAAMKGRRATDKFLSDQGRTYLGRLIGRRTEGLVFQWPYDNGGEFRTLRRHYRRILESAGVSTGSPRESFHKLRRTTATEAWKQGGEATAADLLDHSSAAITQRYIDRRKGEAQNVAASIERPTIYRIAGGE